MRRSANIAECVDIASVTMNSDPKIAIDFPYPCSPSFNNKCQYRMKNGEIAFNLTCECAMTKNDKGEDEGYCPLPNKQVIEGYIEAIKAVWYQDNCHTLDRVNYRSAIACGIGNYDTSLSDALDLKL